MEEVIKGMLADEMLQGSEEFQTDMFPCILNAEIKTNQQKMYILSNHKGINGATCLLYENVLYEFAQLIQSDFYILPSSIHEIILVPYDKTISKETLADMVKDVNRTQVARDEVLSDRVYFFSRKNNAITM
jgi:hypothetical protein